MIKNAVESLRQMVQHFRFEPFASIAQPIIEEVLAEHKKEKYRKGTILTPVVTIWLVLALTQIGKPLVRPVRLEKLLAFRE